MTRQSVLWLTLLAILLPAARTVAQEPPIPDFETWVESEMERWRLPGMAIGIVRDDSLVYARGFGVRRLGSPERVDENTVFGVASTSKAMTAAALAMLVDEGRLHWDDPVIRYLPDFQLSDPWVSEHVTIRDLLTHRVGVGRITGNRLRFIPNRTRAELLHQMRYHEFERPFREGYVYSNAMYTVAGEVVAAVSGMSWDRFLRERLFQPLGMDRSSTGIDALVDDPNTAWPHQEIDGEIVEIPRRDWTVAAPSAAVNTSVREMSAWMRMNLGEPGVHRGLRLVSERSMLEMHSPQVALGGNALDGTAFSAYGLGWNLRQQEGRWIAQHSGATDGMNTLLVLVPSERLGVIVMTNSFNALMTAVANRIVDAALDAPERDWGAMIWDGHQRVRTLAQARRDSIHAARDASIRPSLPIAAYAGAYDHPLYLDAEVADQDGSLVLRLWDDPEMTADLEHWEGDRFRAVWRNRSMREEFVDFEIGSGRTAAAMTVEWSLRPLLLQVGAYPTDYFRRVRFERR
jgi:CubicO group peptidase (beta-lactamase class C family)